MESRKIEISIVMPIYNLERFLEQSMDSLLDQTFQDFEIICVDDGSKDRTPQILENYEKMDSRIQVLKQQNLYAGVARNNGMKKAQGKYIIFLDGDDFFENTFLEKLYNQAEKYQTDICICNANAFNHSENKIRKPKQYLDTRILPSKAPFSWRDIPDVIFSITSPAPWNMLYRREFIEENNLEFQDCQRANDLRFFGMAMVKAEKIATINERLVNYRKMAGAGNLQSMNDKTPLLFMSALEQIKEELVSMGIYENVKIGFANLVLNTSVYNLNSLKTPQAFQKLYQKFFSDGVRMADLDTLTADHFYNKLQYAEFERLRDTELSVLLKRFEKEETVGKETIKQVIDCRQYGDDECKASIIIPVYNTGEYLAAALESARNQTLSDIEIICVNDGSTDRSIEILKEFAQRDPRIVVVDKCWQGVAVARNVGMRMAKGEYILFLDSDDYLKPEAVEHLYDRAHSDGFKRLDLILYNLTVEEKEQLSEKEAEFKKYYTRTHNYMLDMPGQELFSRMIRNNEFRESVCAQFFRRKFLCDEHIVFKEGMLHEDNYFSFKALLRAELAGYLKESLYIRRVRDGSIMTKQLSAAHLQGYFTAYIQMLSYAANFEGPQDVQSSILKAVRRVYIACERTYRQLDKGERKKIDFSDNLFARILFDLFRKEMNQKEKMEKEKQKVAMQQSDTVFSKMARHIPKWLSRKE